MIDPTKLYCICRQPESNCMIACEECDQWFHTACFNLSSEQIDDENYVFICADCDKKLKKIGKGKKIPQSSGLNRQASAQLPS